MELVQSASAGTLRQGDALVEVWPHSGVELEICSVVWQQYGEEIRQTVLEVLQLLQVDGARVRLEDQGALDPVLRARVETALRRAAGEVSAPC